MLPDADRPEPTSQGLAKEISAMYIAALLLILACVLVAAAVPFVAQNLYALVAAIFVGLPYWWLGKKGANFDRFALTWDRLKPGVAWGLLFTALTVGPFAVGYWWWETHYLNREYDFAADNFFKWPVDYEGRPTKWGQTRGVWVWSDGPELHIGLRAGDKPVAVEVSAPGAARPTVIGPARLRAGGKSGAGDWTVRLEHPHKRAEVSFARRNGRAPPREMHITARNPVSGRPVRIHQGSTGAVTDASVDLGRSLTWVVLWVLTQLVFIAFPEEFFYRGYLLTRIGQALDRRRAERGLPAGRKKWWGISAENVLASVLFAAGHVLIPIGGVLMITRASVFFPSLLFGWLRERSDTIAASVVFHAACNLMVLLAAPHFF